MPKYTKDWSQLHADRPTWADWSLPWRYLLANEPTASWDNVHARFPTWADANNVTWEELMQPGLIVAVDAGIPSAEAFGTPTLHQQIGPGGAIPSAEAFGAATVLPGPVSITPAGIPTQEAFGTPAVAWRIGPEAIPSAEAFGSATITTGPVDITMHYEATIKSDGPAGYWRLGEESGTTAFDSSGNGHDATWQGGEPARTDGLIASDDGAVVLYSATPRYATLPTTGVADAGNEISAEAWYRPAALPATGQAPSFITEDYPTGSSVRFTLGFQDNKVFAGFFDGAWTRATAPIAATVGVGEKWAGTYDGTTIRLYRNGEEVATNVPARPLPAPGAGSEWRIGRRWDQANYLDGTLDEVALYSRALTAEEIAAHYQAGQSSQGIPTAESVGIPAVSPGPVQLAPAGLASAEEFGTADILRGPVHITEAGNILTAQAVGDPVVAGPITVPGGVVSKEAFGSPVVTGPITVHEGIPSAEAFGLAELTRLPPMKESGPPILEFTETYVVVDNSLQGTVEILPSEDRIEVLL